MSSVVEEIRAEVEEAALAKGRAENQKATALQMLRMGRFSFTLEDIAERLYCCNMLILHGFTCTR